MTTNFYLDRRYDSGTGLSQVKIALNHAGSSTYISTGIRVPTVAWNARAHKIKNDYPNSARLNIALATKKLDVDTAIEELRKAGSLRGLSLPKIRKAVLAYLSPEREAETSSRLIARMERYRDTRKKERTAETYESTIRKIREFDAGADRLTFDDITPEWLTRFDDFMARTSPSANARNIRLRCIRAVFNDAIADGLTITYPFHRFKIRAEATPSRALSREQLRTLFSYQCDRWQQRYLDMFRLSFLLTGINIIDLANLRELHNGRVEGRRAKTNQPFSVIASPEALDIINKYKGKDWLLDIRDRWKSERDFLHRMNHGLQRIGTHYNPHTKVSTGEPLFPGLSSYWARHSWSNIAAELDVPNEVIDAALGHKARGVISVYVRLNYNRKVDEANRRVIDYIFSD